MSAVPRTIVPSSERCPKCGTQMLTTLDAIGRPRDRCPSCQGVVREPMEAGVVGSLHRQTATCKAELHWDLTQTAPKAKYLASLRCIDCNAELPAQSTGRPRQRCAKRIPCLQRQRGVA